jgi:putative flavoprotein involved in K+ transport
VDDVVIVRAGPAGLATAATLRARGIDATIIERGRVGEPWRSRYDRLHFHAIRSLSHLPGYRIPRDFGRWVARDQFVQYLERYAAHHRLVPRFGVDATRIDRHNGYWTVRTTARICRGGLAHSMDQWFIRWTTAIRSRITTRTC